MLKNLFYGGKKMENIQQLSINTIRFLAAEAIQKAKSGHPGLKPP